MNKIIKFPKKDRKVRTGTAIVGYARTRNIFVSVTDRAKKMLKNLFKKETSPEEVAKEIAELMENGSIEIKKDKDN